ncbi:hypothetical protein LTR85_008527 [Meristemomyces frigidus]|nr:hypothetical protein LTR85_008527 [Meristemomyces frigidus]
MRITKPIALLASTLLGVSAGGAPGGRPWGISGDCCAVWDALQNHCLESMHDPGYGYTCHRFDQPPLPRSADAVPKGCYVWRMKSHKCLEWGPGRPDGMDDPAGGPDSYETWVDVAPSQTAETVSVVTERVTVAPIVVTQTVIAAPSTSPITDSTTVAAASVD